jgi:GT2 family glycosyltransferase
MKITIIIANWNACHFLFKCICSLFEYPPLENFEIIVVDNASTDGSNLMVRERYPQVYLIENPENVGFARANNQAIRQADGKYVLLLNSDTVARQNALKELVNFMDDHPEAGAAGARLLNPDDTLQPNCFPEPTLLRELLRMFHLSSMVPGSSYHMENWTQKKPREVDIIQGACLILRREALDQVGLLDENFFFYSEDVDLCYRLRRAGWHLYWVPTAELIHYGGQSSQLVATDSFIRLYQGKIQYMRKHHGRITGIVYKLFLMTASLSRLVLVPFTIFERTALRHQHLTLANHYSHLLAALAGM